MSGEPSPKRQRTEEPVEDAAAAGPTPEETAKIQKVLNEVADVEVELENENEKQAKEILKIETKYNMVKAPTFAKRSKLLRDIPHFWKQALENHPLIGNLIDDSDSKILAHVESLDVLFTDDFGSFKIELSLSENPFLSSTTLWKQITFSEDDEAEPEITASELAWKDTDEAKEAKDASSFFDWFASTDGVQDIAEIIKDDLFKSPVQYYLEDSEDEDEDEEEEGGESNDDEDEEGGDEEEPSANEE